MASSNDNPEVIGATVNDFNISKANDRLEIEGNDELSKTFIFGNEDHTLGNSLRHVLAQRKETEFCAYSVPHPYEPKMNVRLQAHEGTTSVNELMKNGLQDLSDTCDLINDTFEDALKKFNN